MILIYSYNNNFYLVIYDNNNLVLYIEDGCGFYIIIKNDYKLLSINNKNSTMQLMVDDEGLKVRVKLDVENNTDAKNLYSAIKRGDVTGMSFMFTVRGEEITDENTDSPLRTITDIEKVFEVSAVTFPAYEDTEINARCKLELENFRRTLENVKNITSDDVKGDNDKDLELLKLKIKTKLNLK